MRTIIIPMIMAITGCQVDFAQPQAQRPYRPAPPSAVSPAPEPSLKPLYTDEIEAMGVAQRLKATLVVIVSEPWCRPCQELKADIKGLQGKKRLTGVVILVVDSNSQRFPPDAGGIPTMYTFKHGTKFVDKFVGYASNENQLLSRILKAAE